MGSAFDAELWCPLELRGEVVMCSFGWPDLVCHLKHEECAIQEPHSIETCGRFDHVSPAEAEARG